MKSETKIAYGRRWDYLQKQNQRKLAQKFGE